MNILTVDLDKLNDEIRDYLYRENASPYIICSEATVLLIEAYCISRYKWCYEPVSHTRYNNDYVSVYEGFYVLIDNSLQLGEIKLR